MVLPSSIIGILDLPLRRAHGQFLFGILSALEFDVRFGSSPAGRFAEIRCRSRGEVMEEIGRHFLENSTDCWLWNLEAHRIPVLGPS